MKLKISEDKSKIVLQESTHEEFHQLKLHLVRTVENFIFKRRHKMGLWDGKIDHFKNGIMRFGLWKEIMNCCNEHGYKFEINKKDFPFDLSIKDTDVKKFCDDYYKDYRVKPTDLNPEGIFTPYEHQQQAVVKMLKYKFGLIEVATAGGKSLIFTTFLFYILKNLIPNAKTLLVVPRSSLVTQFYDDIMDYNLGYNKEQTNPFDLKIEELFSDKPRKVRDGVDPNIYIGTYQTLVTYPPEFFKQFDIVAVDECLHPLTKIKMFDESEKYIKDINIGDKVWSYNTDTKQKEIKEVEYVYHNLSKGENMYEITFDNNKTINITGNHKIRLNECWKRTDEMKIDDEIIGYENMKIKSIKQIVYKDDVYNLRIKDGNNVTNNYFANNLCVSNCHTAKSASLDKILSQTFGYAKYRIGMSGTYPNQNTAEILTIQSLLGPKIITVKAKELMDKGLVTPVKINAMILNYDEHDFAEKMYTIQKSGNGQKAYQLEKEYAQHSLRRKLFFMKLVDKFNDNSLILFNNVAYGKELYDYLNSNNTDKFFYYIDGSTSKDKRETIKTLMKSIEGRPKVLIASFGTFSTGINIPSIYNIVFADSFKSDQIIRQSVGRGLRLFKGKDKLIVFDIVDRFHISYTNILYKQYISRRDNIYKKQEFPVNEVKIKV